MSILTRVLVVVLLVMSLLYLGMTAALFGYRIDFKRQLQNEEQAHSKTKEELTRQVKELEVREKSLKDNLANFGKEVEGLKVNLNAAQTDLTAWKEEHTRLTNELTKLVATYDKLQADLNKQISDNADLQKVTEEFRKRKDEAEKDRASFESKMMESQDNLVKLEKNLKTLEENYYQQAKELNNAKTLIAQYKKVAPMAVSAEEGGQAPKWIEGKILAISEKPGINLVILSIGKNDGVEVGMKFTVYRTDKYIGKVQIEKVEPQISMAFSIKEFQSDSIKVNDNATTSPY